MTRARSRTWLPATIGLLSTILRSAPLVAQPEPTPSTTRLYRAVDGDSLYAHIFLPPSPGKSDSTNAILLFHGGGWVAGTPEWTYPAAQRFADSGLVAVAIEYRLSEGNVTPVDALDDVCAAVAWMRAHGAEFGTTGRVAGYGVSAGGHLIAATSVLAHRRHRSCTARRTRSRRWPKCCATAKRWLPRGARAICMFTPASATC